MYGAAVQLVEAMNKLNGRMDTLEAAPKLTKLQRDWQAGREYAKSKHLSASQIENLEEWMMNRAVGRHDHALALMPQAHGGGIAIGGALPEDEMAALMAGDDRK